MSVEVSVAHSQYQDLNFTFLDCPGSIEFASETYNALVGAGAAIIVCEPVVDRVLTLAPLLKFLDDWEIPHLIFINKMDRCNSHFNEVLQALKSVSSRPLVPQQYPIRQNNEIIGFIDLINEQAYHYHANSPADPVPLPDHLKQEEQSARQEMLETIAEFDDHLLEELLEDINPSGRNSPRLKTRTGSRSDSTRVLRYGGTGLWCASSPHRFSGRSTGPDNYCQPSTVSIPVRMEMQWYKSSKPILLPRAVACP
jgi:translation elongation factor EF-G